MQANLEQVTSLIRALPLEDFDKLREVIDKEENSRCAKNEGEINANRAVEVLQKFHDDFYNEEKDGFTQRELRDAVRWILIKYEEQQRQ